MGENIGKILKKNEEKPNLLLKPNGESVFENKNKEKEEKTLQPKPKKNKKIIMIVAITISVLLLIVILLLLTSNKNLTCSQIIDSNGLVKTTKTKIKFKKDEYYESEIIITYDLGEYKENKDSILADAERLYDINNEKVKTKITSNNKKIKIKIKTNKELKNTVLNQKYQNIETYLKNNGFKCK